MRAGYVYRLGGEQRGQRVSDVLQLFMFMFKIIAFYYSYQRSCALSIHRWRCSKVCGELCLAMLNTQSERAAERERQ